MFGSGEMVVVLAVIMLLFGSSQIPKMAKNLGIAQRELKDALGGDDDKDKDKDHDKVEDNHHDDVTATTSVVATNPKAVEAASNATLSPPVELGSTEIDTSAIDTSATEASAVTTSLDA